MALTSTRSSGTTLDAAVTKLSIDSKGSDKTEETTNKEGPMKSPLDVKTDAEVPPPAATMIGDESKRDLPDIIAKFGTASSTTWIEQRYKIWRADDSTKDRPKIQGYLSWGRFRYAWGRPLCRDEDLRETVLGFVDECKNKHKKPVFACIEEDVAKILEEGIDGRQWHAISCIREDNLQPDLEHLKDNKDVRHNLSKASREGVHVEELRLKNQGRLPTDDVKEEIEDGIHRWAQARHGRQIAAASLQPWLDSEHRRYFIARAKGKIVGLTIITPLAHDSYQIKNSISFPEAPHGTSEELLSSVIEAMWLENRQSLTFGTSAADEIEGANIRGWKFKVLDKAYHEVISKYKLNQRGQFRDKFGVKAEQWLWVAYPPHGFGIEGLVGLIKCLTTSKE